MSQSVYHPNQSITSSMLVCRGCLATDVRLYDMHQNRLMEAYSKLLSTDIHVTDKLPHYLCSYCAALLLKYDTFRIKCIDALLILKKVQLENLTKEHIMTNFKQTDLQIININSTVKHIHRDSDTTYIKDNPVQEHSHNKNKCNQINRLLNKFIEDKGTPLLKDFEINIDNVNNRVDRMKELSEIAKHIQYTSETSTEFFDILNKDYIDGFKCNDNATKYTKPKISLTEVNKPIIKNDKIQNTTNVSSIVSEIFTDSKHEIKNEEIATIPYKVEVKDFASEFNVIKDTEGAVVAILKNKTKIKRKVSNPTDAPYYGCKGLIKDLNKLRKKVTCKMQETNDKSKEFEVLYKTDVTYLSRDEQIKEIEDRKETENYKVLRYKCNLCYKCFVIQDTFNNHMLLHDDISGKYVCDICNYHFTTGIKLKKHKWTHSQVYTCKECGHTTKHTHLAMQHSKWHNGKKYSCKECGKEFRNNSSQYGHIKLCHPTSDQLVRCEICEDSFNGLTGLKFHDRIAHKEMRSQECHCSGCDTQFYCSDAFKTHQGTDGLCDTTYKYCVRCGMSFETEQLLKEHEIEQRKPQNIYKCDICSKTFTFFAHYKMHIRQHLLGSYYNRKTNKKRKKLEGVDSVVCEICGKVYQNTGLLKMHHDVVHKHLKLNKYACTLCPKTYSCNMSLKIHTRTHTGERPFQCDRCPKAFQTNTNLIRHQLVHTGERPYTCDVCGKSFQTKHCVQMHIKTVHMKIPMPPRIRRRKRKTE